MNPFALLRATALIYSMHFGAVFGSKRVLAAFVLAAMPPVLGGLGTRLAPETVDGSVMDGGGIFTAMGVFLFLGFVVPMLSVSIAVGAVADEVETRTITYPFTRPIPRASLFLGRWLASLTLILGLLWLSGGALWWISNWREPGPPNELVHAVLLAATSGAVVYSIGSAVIGTEFKRGLVIALAYAFAFELLVANVPGSSRELTIQYHMRAIVADEAIKELDAEDFLRTKSMISASGALMKMWIVSGVLLLFGCWRVGRKQFVLSA
ncbi:MAG: ABC transporter permease subunit [Planctomycetota bacterium]